MLWLFFSWLAVVCGCPSLPGMMLTIRPYGLPYFNSVILGRTVLVLAGAATLVGCYDITVQAYSVTVSIGNQVPPTTFRPLTAAAAGGGGAGWT